MNSDKLARLTVVLDVGTDRALRRIAELTNQGVSSVVRELLSGPAEAMVSILDVALSSGDPVAKQAALDQLEMFVESSYGDYLQLRDGTHG
jgi:hypothetical protein